MPYRPWWRDRWYGFLWSYQMGMDCIIGGNPDLLLRLEYALHLDSGGT